MAFSRLLCAWERERILSKLDISFHSFGTPRTIVLLKPANFFLGNLSNKHSCLFARVSLYGLYFFDGKDTLYLT